MTRSDSCGVVYLLTGEGYAARLVVSMWSLRRTYQGPITVMATADAEEQARDIVSDRRLDARLHIVEYAQSNRFPAYATKTTLWQWTPYEVTLQLDADTLVLRSIDRLFHFPERSVLLTQFSNWTTATPTIRRRVQAWERLELELHEKRYVERLIRAVSRPWPAVNTGVMAYTRRSRMLSSWRELAHMGRELFIADEVAMQLLMPRWPHELLDDRWNCSPLFGVHRKEAHVWHMHGSKHLAGEAAAPWLATFEECLQANIGRIADWAPGGDRLLAEHLSAKSS
jgi:hypothetical protein